MENVKYIPGDLVKWNGAKGKVLSIERGAISEINCNGYIENIGPIGRTHIESIPLTPAILETNGWDLSIIKNRNYWSKVSSDDELLRFKSIDASIQRIAVKEKIALTYFSSNPNTFFFELSHTVIKIKYLHELQHLLFGLGLDSSFKV